MFGQTSGSVFGWVQRAGWVLVGLKHSAEKCGDMVKVECTVVAVKVGTSVSQSCRVVGVLVSILWRMVWGVGEGSVHVQPVGRRFQKSAVVAVVTVCCAVC